jgi:hypothetical protein
MAGAVRKMLDTIVEQRSKGSELLAGTTRTKLILKGLNPDKFSASSPDDPALVARVREVAAELNVHL